MMFCLDDGAELLYGPASGSEPGAVATGFRGDEGQTRSHVLTTDQTAILQPPATAGGSDSTERYSLSANSAAWQERR